MIFWHFLFLPASPSMPFCRGGRIGGSVCGNKGPDPSGSSGRPCRSVKRLGKEEAFPESRKNTPSSQGPCWRFETQGVSRRERWQGSPAGFRSEWGLDKEADPALRPPEARMSPPNSRKAQH